MPRPVTSPMAKQLNVELGARIAARRRTLGLSAAEVERMTLLRRGGLARIERGDKGLDASLLIALSQVLGVDISYFFEGQQAIDTANKPDLPSAARVEEMIEFLTQYHAITEDAERLRILGLIRSVAESDAY